MKVRVILLAALLTFSLAAQRRAGHSNVSVPVPPDPHELVTGQVQIPAAGERGADLELLQRARQNSLIQISGTAPYRVDAAFTSSSGIQGQFTQTWLAPQAWRWSANLGSTTVVRGFASQGPYADSAAPVPAPVHLLRNAIFNAVYDVAIGTQLRAAAVSFNGHPANCLMTSGVTGAANYSGRLWEELEYCFDNASGQLVSSSFAPGVFTVYSYEGSTPFAGHLLPSRLTMYSGGSQILDATLHVSDAAGTDPASLAPSPGMVPRSAVLDAPMRQPLPMPAPPGINKVSPVLVHANLADGKVADAEVCAASDASLSAAALQAVRQIQIPPGAQQQTYFMVKFVPAQN